MAKSYKPLSKKELLRIGVPVDVCEIILKFTKERIERDLTQKDFAQMLGISESLVKGIERGKNRPTIQLLYVWKRRFRRSWDYILG